MAAGDAAEETVVYVYGIVPADVETDPDARGVGEPPGEIEIVRQGEIAALVSEFPADRPRGKPEDIEAHADLLDATAAEVPVLPVRFGAVMRSQDVVTEELLEANHDEFAAALRELEGKAEYVVKVGYDGEAPAEPESDTRFVVAVLEGLGCTVKVRRQAPQDETTQVACLAGTELQPKLAEAVERLAGRWGSRVRLLGPFAPYDFVAAG